MRRIFPIALGIAFFTAALVVLAALTYYAFFSGHTARRPIQTFSEPDDMLRYLDAVKYSYRCSYMSPDSTEYRQVRSPIFLCLSREPHAPRLTINQESGIHQLRPDEELIVIYFDTTSRIADAQLPPGFRRTGDLVVIGKDGMIDDFFKAFSH